MSIEEQYKELREHGQSSVERLAESPVPLRISQHLPLSRSQIIELGFDGVPGVPFLTVVRDSIFQLVVYGDKVTGKEHLAVVKASDVTQGVPIRFHSSCVTAETFHASNCDCHEQLQIAVNIAEQDGLGGVIWLNQEGRGNGLVAKVQQLGLIMSSPLDTVSAYEKLGYPPEVRDFTPAADILGDLGIQSIRMITDNPYKIKQAEDRGVLVLGRIPCDVKPTNAIMQRDHDAKWAKLGYLY